MLKILTLIGARLQIIKASVLSYAILESYSNKIRKVLSTYIRSRQVLF